MNPPASTGRTLAQNSVASSAVLEVKRCEDWTYSHDKSGWTQIRNECHRLITTFYRTLTHDEVYAFRAGWGVGVSEGITIGKSEKAEEIRKVLGL